MELLCSKGHIFSRVSAKNFYRNKHGKWNEALLNLIMKVINH
jgi:hypothetical protein